MQKAHAWIRYKTRNLHEDIFNANKTKTKTRVNQKTPDSHRNAYGAWNKTRIKEEEEEEEEEEEQGGGGGGGEQEQEKGYTAKIRSEALVNRQSSKQGVCQTRDLTNCPQKPDHLPHVGTPTILSHPSHI